MQKSTINEDLVTRLGEYGTKCPYCQKDIFVPQYRANPITLEEMQKRAQASIRKVAVKVALDTKEISEGCQNCRNNPKAKPPYAKMKTLHVDNDTFNLLGDSAKKHGYLSTGCAACMTTQRLMKALKKEAVSPVTSA
jgi:thiol-disulfide isomerase/thioredoxin